MEQEKKQPEEFLSQDQTGVNSTTDTTDVTTGKADVNTKKQPEEFLSQDQAGVNSVELPESEDPNYVAEHNAQVPESTKADEAATDPIKTTHKEERPLIQQDRPVK